MSKHTMSSNQFSQTTTRQFCQDVAPEETAENEVLLESVPAEFYDTIIAFSCKLKLFVFFSIKNAFS